MEKEGREAMTKLVFKRVISFILVSVFAMSLIACGSGTTATVSVDELLGDWYKKEDDGIEQFVTIKADGKYLSETVSPMGFSLKSENTWTYENGIFTVNYLEYGTQSVYTKVSIDGDQLILDNGVGKLIYTRR